LPEQLDRLMAEHGDYVVRTLRLLCEHYGIRWTGVLPAHIHDDPFFQLALLQLALDHVPHLLPPAGGRKPDTVGTLEFVSVVEKKKRNGANTDSAAINELHREKFKRQSADDLGRKLRRARKDPAVQYYFRLAETLRSKYWRPLQTVVGEWHSDPAPEGVRLDIGRDRYILMRRADGANRAFLAAYATIIARLHGDRGPGFIGQTLVWPELQPPELQQIFAKSPTKRCGKSTLLMLLGELCRRSLLASNLSGAVVFRVIDKHCPSLLIDEADTFAKKDDCLRGVINAGSTKRTAFVLRQVGKQARKFSCWAPRALAAIGRLPGTWEDRAIIVRMRRKKADERVALLRQDRLDLDHIRRRLARWAQDHGVKPPMAEPAMPPGFESRMGDNWRPLFSIADLAGGTWPERARGAAVTLSSASEDGDDAIQLLSDIRSLLVDPIDRIRSVDLVHQLAAMEERAWPEFRQARKPITQAQIARLLKPFGIVPKSIRLGPNPNDTARGLPG
jgi:hypothetical protein